ncbi:alkanesulfonate monooxygenase SsuD/methylene tetrahydromethanopterin reductase-like flavin-dependent oxidoreductase (luciferase family) [Nocardiopsis mwathae]|uniref:Alkanesulfonate monooxygenase SsuD/methylene tetrahydromethanopterin reductase-like flavin-dependent oxidoreductase (Luciferase family) n=1 Tax=Nocardiopsis mwathae TaxID=1472723 RepID=A0A7W9YKP0_9ACTN|nr:LLM class flavin-dependent oxidoreductase [Nocardiopsis mwathae]MBB6172961.1 alkanesulfonate monooxygenase SsuD/methylene tetrahydromethanopterin reductase-like flavin-dependent oxidoreductase (luciferase family) [Nocardiopsis mwathae]
MKFAIFMNPQIPGSGFAAEEHARAHRPIGRDVHAYQDLLHEVREIAVHADRIGFDALMLTEHHFHSEGFEFSVNPLMVLADLAARTERILLAPLGLVLPAWDPIRAAEDVALLDHFCRGRLRLGVARGYQSRWANVLGQRWRSQAARSDGSASDDRNFDVFGELLKIMKMAWTQETLRYKSDVVDYEIPSPYSGIEGWPAQEWTRTFGAPGELDGEGRVRRVSVVPRPYQDPHPELWQPFTISDRSVRRCAREDILPWMFTPLPGEHRKKAELYREEAARHGRDYRLGEHTGILKIVGMAGSKEEAVATYGAGMHRDFSSFFGPFGYLEVLRTAEDDARRPISAEKGDFRRMAQVRMALVGSPDDVKRGIEETLAEVPDLEWFGLFMQGQQGVLPLDAVKRNLEMFAEKVIPEFRG